MRAAFIVALVAAVSLTTLAACLPMPQRVKDEFSRYDGERPNNFQTGKDDSVQESPEAGASAGDAGPGEQLAQ